MPQQVLLTGLIIAPVQRVSRKYNVSHQWWEKAERRRSSAFCHPLHALVMWFSWLQFSN